MNPSEIAQWLGNLQAPKRRTQYPATGSYNVVAEACQATRVIPEQWGLSMRVERISNKVIAIAPVWSDKP